MLIFSRILTSLTIFGLLFTGFGMAMDERMIVWFFIMVLPGIISIILAGNCYGRYGESMHPDLAVLIVSGAMWFITVLYMLDAK